jgi:hypothetical protein
MCSNDAPKLNEGYRAEYGPTLRLLVQQKEESVKILVFDKISNKPIWKGDTQSMQDAKDTALAHAVRHLSKNPLAGSQGLPVWEPYTDEISNL